MKLNKDLAGRQPRENRDTNHTKSSDAGESMVVSFVHLCITLFVLKQMWKPYQLSHFGCILLILRNLFNCENRILKSPEY